MGPDRGSNSGHSHSRRVDRSRRRRSVTGTGAAGTLADIEPFRVAAYTKALRVSDRGNPAVKERAAARPTVKQHLAAIRMLFDWLIVGHVLAINPAHAVHGP